MSKVSMLVCTTSSKSSCASWDWPRGRGVSGACGGRAGRCRLRKRKEARPVCSAAPASAWAAPRASSWLLCVARLRADLSAARRGRTRAARAARSEAASARELTPLLRRSWAAFALLRSRERLRRHWVIRCCARGVKAARSRAKNAVSPIFCRCRRRLNPSHRAALPLCCPHLQRRISATAAALLTLPPRPAGCGAAPGSGGAARPARPPAAGCATARPRRAP